MSGYGGDSCGLPAEVLSARNNVTLAVLGGVMALVSVRYGNLLLNPLLPKFAQSCLPQFVAQEHGSSLFNSSSSADKGSSAFAVADSIAAVSKFATEPGTPF